MRASYNSISSARRFSSWLMVVLGLAAYVGLLYGLTMLPLQVEVPLPHWGVAVVPPLVYGLLVVLCVRWPSPLRWLVGTAMLSGLHVLLGFARGPISAFLDPSLAGRPIPWVLPPPLPELVGLILLLVPLRDLLRARPRSARERTSTTGRAPTPVRGRSVPLRPTQPAPAEGRYTPGEAVAVPQVEVSPEPVVPAVPPGPTLDPDPTGDARRRRAAVRAERRREAEIARPARRSDVVLRIALDRVMDQLPPGTFLAPEDEVAASLSDPGYLVIPGQLVVTQLSEGIARVAWSDIVDQFPPRLIGLGSAEISEHLGDGLRLPLDEVVGQLPHELFIADTPAVELSGLDRIPVPFHPLEESDPFPSVAPQVVPEAPPTPIIERPRMAPLSTPEHVVAEPPRAPQLEPPPVSAPERPAPIEEAVVSALEPEPRPEPIHVPEPQPIAVPVSAPVVDEATVRVSFDRVAADLPAEAFRGPLEQLAAQMQHPGALLIPLSRVLPQLGEGLIRVGWDVVASQFPREQMAVSDAEMTERLPNGIHLPLDEVIRQISPDLFMTSGPAIDVRGLESFPAPFQPLLSDPAPEPAPAAPAEAPAPIAAAAAMPEPLPVPEPAPVSGSEVVVERAPVSVSMTEPVPASVAEPPRMVEPPPAPVEVPPVGDPLAAEPPLVAEPRPAVEQATPPPPIVADWPPVPEPVVNVEPSPVATEPAPLVAPPPRVEVPEPRGTEPVSRPVPVAPAVGPVVPAPTRRWPVASSVESGPVPALSDPATAAETRRILTLLAPIASFEATVQSIEGVTVFAMAAPTVTPETAAAATGLALPLLTESRAPWLLDQITLRGPETALVLTPLTPANTRGSVLATATARGGALALLEMLCQRAAAKGSRRVAIPAGPPPGERSRSLVPAPVTAQLTRQASSLTAYGQVTASVLRDTEGEGVFYFFLPPGVDVPAVGAFAQDLQAVLRKAAGSGAVFRTAVLRSGNTLVVIQPEEVGHGRSIVVVAGGEVTRPGLAYRQVERATTILAQA
jgi:hypothetical protein